MAEAIVPSSPPTLAPTRYLPTLAAFVFAIVMAALTYRDFLAVHRYLWNGATHDRNAHYLFALRLATDVEQFRVGRLIYDVDSARMWPPLYGILAAGTMLVGGRDYCVAVLPSLAAWIGTVAFAFLAARRAVPRGGVLAGFIAVLFIAASPAHRAYATDIMLESLGACLTLAVVYAYIVVVQNETASPWPGRWLAAALTALFLTKYNYWMICVVTLLATELLRRPGYYWLLARNTAARFDWRLTVRTLLRSPLTYVLAILTFLVVAVKWHSPEPLVIAGHEVSSQPPNTLMTIAYAVFFVKLVLWWRRVGCFELARYDISFPPLVLAHAWPVAAWFLMPKRVGSFLWYMSFANGGDEQKASVLEGLQYYLPRVASEYHSGLWCAVLASVLLIPAVLAARRLRPGGMAILVLIAVGLALTVTHPNHKGRYLHTWIALGWLGAGLGAAALVYGPLTARLSVARPWLSAATLVTLACVLLPGLRAPAYAPEGGAHPKEVSLLDVTDSYLPEIGQSNRTAILSAVALKPLAQWTFLERKGELETLEKNWYGYGPLGDGNREQFKKWLQEPNCDMLVYVDHLPGSGIGWEEIPEVALHAELRDLVFSQQVFRLVKWQEFPRHGCSVLVFSRLDPLIPLVASGK